MQRFVTVLLVVIAFGSVTGLAWMMARPNPADPRVATLEADLRTAQKEISRLREQLAQRPAASPAVTPSSPAVSSTTPSTSSTGAPTVEPGTGGKLREVLGTPGMRAMIEQQQAMQIDKGYGPLFDVLQLSAAERANLRQLLLDREKMQTDYAMKIMDPNLPEGARKQMVRDMVAEKNKYDESFKTFLNNTDDYATFKQWEDTQPERLQFDTVGRNLFAQSGEPLSADQEQKLINTAAQVRRAPNPALATADPATLDPANLTDAGIQNYLDQMKKNDDQVAAQASSFLSPGQMKALAAYQEQARNMALTGMKMSAALNGKGGK